MREIKLIADVATIKDFKEEFYLIFCKRKMNTEDIEELIRRDKHRHKDIHPDYFGISCIDDHMKLLKMLEARYVLRELIEADYDYVEVHRKELEKEENVDYYIFSKEDTKGFVWCLKVDAYNYPCCFELCKVDDIKELPKQEDKPIYELAYEIGVYWREK